MELRRFVPLDVHVANEPLRVRAIAPSDEPALRRGFANLSPEARYARFRGFGTPSDAQWRYLTRVDGIRHVAIVATTEDGEIVGVARFVATNVPGEAEAAFTIADRFRGKRLGTVLLDVLIGLARERGIVSLVAYTSGENLAMIRLFLGAGGAHVSTRLGEVELVLSTSAQTAVEVAPETRSLEGRTARARRAAVRIAARARLSARRALRATPLADVLSWIGRGPRPDEDRPRHDSAA